MPSPHPKATLLVARPDDGGSASPHALSARVDAGELLRIRPGVYLEPHAWIRSPPWERPLIAAAAQALARPETIFCRETALSLHGVSLLHPEDFVHIRVSSNASAGRRAPRAMTGRTSMRRLQQLCHLPDGTTLNAERALRNVPTRAFQFPQRYRVSLKKGLDPSASRNYRAALVDVELPELQEVSVPGLRLRAEPVELATMDTVHRLSFPSAISVLDGLRGGRHRAGTELVEVGLLAWGEALPSRRARLRTDVAWKFSDGRSANPGESWSRVLIHDLGFEPPDLQVKLITPDGSLYSDFGWEAAGVVGEFDGNQKYLQAEQYGLSPQQAVLHEKRREDGIRRLGYDVARWNWQTLQNPWQLESVLREKGVPRRGL